MSVQKEVELRIPHGNDESAAGKRNHVTRECYSCAVM